MIRLYRRNRVFWIDYSESGKRRQRSLRTRDTQTARALLRQIEIEILSGGKLRPAPAWSEFEEEFLSWIEPQIKPNTWRLYRHYARRFGKYLDAAGISSLDTVDEKIIAVYHERRKLDRHPDWQRPRTPSGMRFELRHLRRILNYAVERGYLKSNPITQRNLNAPANRTLPFTQQEIEAMLRDAQLHADPQLRAIILTFLHTGLRISDVINLRRDELQDERLTRRTQKRGRTVTLRIHPELQAAIARHLDAAPASDYLFATSTGRRIVALDRILRRLWKRAGVAGGHAHRFRDTFAVRLLQHGATLYDVAKLLGISVQTAERHYAPYVKELQERGAHMVELLDFV